MSDSLPPEMNDAFLAFFDQISYFSCTPPKYGPSNGGCVSGWPEKLGTAHGEVPAFYERSVVPTLRSIFNKPKIAAGFNAYKKDPTSLPPDLLEIFLEMEPAWETLLTCPPKSYADYSKNPEAIEVKFRNAFNTYNSCLTDSYNAYKKIYPDAKIPTSPKFPVFCCMFFYNDPCWCADVPCYPHPQLGNQQDENSEEVISIDIDVTIDYKVKDEPLPADLKKAFSNLFLHLGFFGGKYGSQDYTNGNCLSRWPGLLMTQGLYENLIAPDVRSIYNNTCTTNAINSLKDLTRLPGDLGIQVITLMSHWKNLSPGGGAYPPSSWTGFGKDFDRISKIFPEAHEGYWNALGRIFDIYKKIYPDAKIPPPPKKICFCCHFYYQPSTCYKYPLCPDNTFEAYLKEHPPEELLDEI